MDTKHRKVYGRLKIYGVKEPIMIEELSMNLFLRSVLQAFIEAPNRYEGWTLEGDFKPIESQLTEFEQFQKEIYAGLDMSQIEQATEEEEAMYARGNPSDPKSIIYDPIYAEYIACISSKHRETKTPTDLTVIRKHVEDKYRGTQWWDGAHRW